MKKLFVFFCLLLPCLSAMGQQTMYLSTDTVVEKDSLHKNTLIFHQFRVPEIEGVGSTYERAQKDALSKIRRLLCLADYEDIPKLSLWWSALWTEEKCVHVKLRVDINDFFDYEKHLRNRQDTKRKKLTARKMTKTERESMGILSDNEEVIIHNSEYEFRKKMQDVLKSYKENK